MPSEGDTPSYNPPALLQFSNIALCRNLDKKAIYKISEGTGCAVKIVRPNEVKYYILTHVSVIPSSIKESRKRVDAVRYCSRLTRNQESDGHTVELGPFEPASEIGKFYFIPLKNEPRHSLELGIVNRRSDRELVSYSFTCNTLCRFVTTWFEREERDYVKSESAQCWSADLENTAVGAPVFNTTGRRQVVGVLGPDLLPVLFYRNQLQNL